MSDPIEVLGASNLWFVWQQATIEGKSIIIALIVFSMLAWTVMITKATQFNRAKRLNHYFDSEFRRQRHIMAIFNRKVDVEGCPLFSVYQNGCQELESHLQTSEGGTREGIPSKSMEQVKRTLERSVAEESLGLESGLILLAVAVSGAPFVGLLGTVWGVMSVFSEVAIQGQADLLTMAPGLASAMMTTVAGLLVAIPSMFGYNWLVHHVRVLTVELDNFAQELTSRFEGEYLTEEGAASTSSSASAYEES